MHCCQDVLVEARKVSVGSARGCKDRHLAAASQYVRKLGKMVVWDVAEVCGGIGS